MQPRAPPLPQAQAQDELRPIGSFDEPNTRGIELGIRPPPIPNNNFHEIKSSMINLVQNSTFNGLPSENPLDHLDRFGRLCRTLKMNGVTEDTIRMILFPFSLGNKASQWERNIPSELVTNWDQWKKEFLSKFFPKQKAAVEVETRL